MELKRKSLSSFGLLLATRGGWLSACVPKWHPFFGNGYTWEKSLEFDLSLYALKRGHGLLFSLGSPFYIQLFIEPGMESPHTFISKSMWAWYLNWKTLETCLRWKTKDNLDLAC